MKPFRGALDIVSSSRRAFFALNISYFGLIICGMIFGASHRALQQSVLDGIGNSLSQLETTANGLTQGQFSAMVRSQDVGIILLSIVFIFSINLLLGSVIELTLPSLLIPFSGYLVGSLRAFVWGLIFLPDTLEISAWRLLRGALVLILLLLEGEGYVLATFAVYRQGKAFLFPRRVGATTRRQGYWAGIKDTVRLYPLVALVLAIAAAYEALLVIVIMPSLV